MKLNYASILMVVLLCSCKHKPEHNKIETDKIETDKIVNNNTVNKPHEIRPSKELVEIEKPIYFKYSNVVDDLGIGLIIAPPEFKIYHDSLLKEEFVSINMYRDILTVYAKYTKPDYGIMHFACLKATDTFFEVMVNQSEIKYMPNSKQYKFYSWQEYMANSFGVRRNTSNPVRQAPTTESNSIVLPEGLEMFCPLDIRGDWINVKWDCFYNLDNNPFVGEPCNDYIDKCDKSLTGWLRWKNKNEVLIDIFKLL